jgi:glutathione S-transferase
MLRQKQIPFKIQYIDLNQPPPWFLAISPTGKVPLLRCDGEVLFESAVICEFLNESYPPSYHPEAAIPRAKHRAYIEFASTLIGLQYATSLAKTLVEYTQQRETLQRELAKLEPLVNAEGYFEGYEFCLVDVAFAPLFMRLAVLDHAVPLTLTALPNIAAWRNRLLSLPSVQGSVIPEFTARFKARFAAQAAYFATRLETGES